MNLLSQPVANIIRQNVTDQDEMLKYMHYTAFCCSGSSAKGGECPAAHFGTNEGEHSAIRRHCFNTCKLTAT